MPLSTDIEVHRVLHTVTQKVEPVANSFHPDASYIVMDNKRKDLAVWVGLRCGHVDRKIAENLGARIKHDEFKKATAANHITVCAAPADPDSFILTCLSVSAKQFHSAKRSHSISNDKIVLMEISVSSSGGAPTTREVAKKTPVEGGHSKLDFTDFDAHKVFILECGRYERYLWVGGRVPFKQQKALKDHLKNMYGDADYAYVYVHEHMEGMLFKNKFSHVKEAFEKLHLSSKSHSLSKSSSQPPIDAEVKRTVDESFGTLKMVSNSRGQLGDCLRQGLLMDFAEDESGILSIYHVSVNGSSRQLVEIYSSKVGGEAVPVIFSQSGAYAVLYVCKNGARGLVYLWVGSLCPPDIQAALALRVKEIIPSGIGADQLQLQQGREPQLLLKIIQSKRYFPLCVLNAFELPIDKPVSEIALTLEVSQLDLKLDGLAPQVTELPFEQSQKPMSPFKCRVCVAVSLNPPNAKSANYTAKSITATIYIGELTSESVRDGSRKIASNIVEILKIQQECTKATVETDLRRQARSMSVSSPQDTSNKHNNSSEVYRSRSVSTSASPTDIGTGKIISISSVVKAKVSEKIVRSASKNVFGLRPVRLFQVSHTRRSVGAIFIEEIGIGGVFIQEDLSSLECYILDDGGEHLYVWIGSDCMYPAMALATRVARIMVTEMIRVTSPPKVVSYGATMIGDYFRLPVEPLKIEFIRQFCEPIEFVQFFKSWESLSNQNAFASSKNAGVQFNPDSIPDDESTDCNRGIDGRLLSETFVQKPRYADTVEYKRNQSPSVDIIERKSENFCDLKLKTTPSSSQKSSHSDAVSSTASNGRKSEDFRSVKLSTPVTSSPKPSSSHLSQNNSPIAPVLLHSSYSPPKHNKQQDKSNAPEFVNYRSKLRPVSSSATSGLVEDSSEQHIRSNTGESTRFCCCFPFLRSKGNKKKEKEVMMPNSSAYSPQSLQYSQNNKEALLPKH